MPFQKGHGSLRSKKSYKKQGERMIGHLVSDKTREILRLKFKGRKVSKKSRIKDSKAIKNLWKQKWYRDKLVMAHKGKFLETESPSWKGDDIGYNGLHEWVNRKLGKASRCENPKCIYPRKNARGKLIIKPTRFHWANKNHIYKRNLTDWISLCPSCHKNYDKCLK